MTDETDATLLTLTADIAAAHVSNNSVSVGDMAGLIASVHQSLSGLGTTAAAEPEEELRPAVSVRSSVKPDYITCLTCGDKLKMLKRHLNTDHHQTPAEYKAQWKLPANYPLVAPNYAEQRRALAKKIGLGTKRRKPAPARRGAGRA